jgi:uncharacterized C2H2 Zn-finger protein
MKEIKIDEYGKCPKCGTSWDGGAIPKNIRKHYSKPYRWSRLIGVEIQEKYDGVWYWKCPDCGANFNRFK